jgi:hypothetical protein
MSTYSPQRTNGINAVSFLAQAAYALLKGNRKLALVLAGIAPLAYKWSKLGYVVQGILTLYRLFKRLR